MKNEMEISYVCPRCDKPISFERIKLSSGYVLASAAWYCEHCGFRTIDFAPSSEVKGSCGSEEINSENCDCGADEVFGLASNAWYQECCLDPAPVGGEVNDEDFEEVFK